MTTKKYFWLTDTHFNFVTRSKLISYFLEIQSQKPDGIFLTGDISTGSEIEKHLLWLSKLLNCPIYFVIGNHDFYRSSFSSIESNMTDLMNNNDNLFYLNDCNPISLSKNVALVGDNGWYDNGFRDPLTPLIYTWDFFFIKDFRALFSNSERMKLVRERAKLSSIRIVEKLKLAFENHSLVYLLVHVPPWPEKTDKWGGLIEKFWMPYNSSKFIADAISKVMMENPDKKLIVLSGHNHHEREEKISHNIWLKVGEAQHNVCQIQDIIFIGQ